MPRLEQGKLVGMLRKKRPPTREIFRPLQDAVYVYHFLGIFSYLIWICASHAKIAYD
jgi:hypothetical protein